MPVSAVVVFAYTATTDRTCTVSRIGVVMICFVVIVNVQKTSCKQAL